MKRWFGVGGGDGVGERGNWEMGEQMDHRGSQMVVCQRETILPGPVSLAPGQAASRVHPH